MRAGYGGYGSGVTAHPLRNGCGKGGHPALGEEALRGFPGLFGTTEIVPRYKG